MSERITLNIEVQVKKDKATALKRLYEAQSAIPVISKYQTQITGIANAMMDDVLIDIRIPTKENIKQAIIAYHGLTSSMIKEGDE